MNAIYGRYASGIAARASAKSWMSGKIIEKAFTPGSIVNARC